MERLVYQQDSVEAAIVEAPPGIQDEKRSSEVLGGIHKNRLPVGEGERSWLGAKISPAAGIWLANVRSTIRMGACSAYAEARCRKDTDFRYALIVSVERETKTLGMFQTGRNRMGGKAMGGRRVSYQEGIELATEFIEILKKNKLIERVEIAGSLRRKKVDSGDIDLVVIPTDGETMNQFLGSLWGWCKPKRKADPLKAKRSGLFKGVQIDVVLATNEDWGSNLMYLSGSAETNIAQRRHAQSMGLMLSNYGVMKDGVRIAGKTEEECYQALGLDWIEPENR